ncbi:hypothetical protein ABB37_09738 [Leptomonas pyrrhocoris]|uniref:DDRGK domain-containing protein 1 n=1 Tax=Leptomonas pyrrhocoris TaxID=157538 RepID=A0A0M9FQ51_LEPPY|nr:hypothetical protein ABB37_09738 [Leptomonas pyrrhocoris]KPA73606.1 hypothetical protein ABB37_09738 [Leptomonas pyrrhocoris]|eukprot:XP_015652045.1 hypothetical protein ABB37_09738 [Leptomonas pyrrhocoris]
MSMLKVVATLLLLVLGGAVLLRWMQGRHASEWEDGVGNNGDSKRGKKNGHRKAHRGRAPAQGDSNGGDSADEEDVSDADNAAASVAGGRGGLQPNAGRGVGGGLRRRGQRGARGLGATAEPHDDADGEDDDAYDEHGVKLTRLQRKKLAKERERAERRQAQEAALEAQRERSDETTLRAAEAELREEELHAAEESALRQLRADKERADNEEYAKWVGHIGVEERGELGDEARERQTRVQAFLLERAAQVQARARRSSAAVAATCEPHGSSEAHKEEEEEGKDKEKEGHVLVLQAAARELKVSVEELVTTIEQLTREGKVDGVFDDRGKYVFIAPEHFPQLAQFLRLRGRVSVQEFTRECNRVVMQA